MVKAEVGKTYYCENYFGGNNQAFRAIVLVTGTNNRGVFCTRKVTLENTVNWAKDIFIGFHNIKYEATKETHPEYFL